MSRGGSARSVVGGRVMCSTTRMAERLTILMSYIYSSSDELSISCDQVAGHPRIDHAAVM